jgi:type IV pilus assembly protein PilW
MSRVAPNAQCGFSLIGVMIALVLGAFLLAGVLQVFVSAKQTFAVQDALSRLQENGRSAMDFMGRRVRMASYWACLARAPGDIVGTDDNAASGDNIDNGTDTITLRGAFDSGVAGTIAGACRTPVNTGAGYYTNAGSMAAYFVDNGVLFERIGAGGTANPLIEGVENMQILYGEDTDGDGSANYYVPADEIVNMDRVVAVRVSLLVRSPEDNLTAEPVPYTYNGATTTPTDRRLRRVFTSTFGLRNRLP